METCCKARKFEQICAILDKFNRNPSKLIPILQETQKVYGYLPQEALVYIATGLGLSPAKVYGAASFYANFSLNPKGKYIIHICDGTACHVKGSEQIKEALLKKLNLSADKNTTDDMLFTVLTVSCLGACGLAPVITINEKVYGQVTPQMAQDIVQGIIDGEKNQ